MPALDATVKGASANSYLTVSAADVILAQWLDTKGWDAATTSPSAEDYETSAPASIGDTQVSVDSGSGDVTVGMLFQFVGTGDTTIYTTLNSFSGSGGTGTIRFSPKLVAAAPDGTPIDRLTANQKEQAVILGTFSLDSSMEWEGFKRDITTPQALDHPRSGMFDANGDFFEFDLLAPPLLDATAYQANVLLERNILKKPELLGQGFTRARADVFSVSLDSSSSATQLEPVDDFVQAILSDIGRLKAITSRGGGMVPLLRS